MQRSISKDNTGGGSEKLALGVIARKKPNLVGDQLPVFGSDRETNPEMDPYALSSRGDMHTRFKTRNHQLPILSTSTAASIANTRAFKLPREKRLDASVVGADTDAFVELLNPGGPSVCPTPNRPPFNNVSQSGPHAEGKHRSFSRRTSSRTSRKRSRPSDGTDQRPAKKLLLQDLAMELQKPTWLPTHIGNANPKGENVAWPTFARHNRPAMNKKLELTVAAKFEPFKVGHKDWDVSMCTTISKDNTAGDAIRLKKLYHILDRGTEDPTAEVRSAAEKSSDILAETPDNIAGRDENDDISKVPPVLTYDCLFHKLDPIRFDACGNVHLTTWPRVLQHIRRKHVVRDEHRPTCRCEFSEERIKKEHIRQRHCQTLDIEQTGLLFQEDYEKLKQLKLGFDEDKWKAAWEKLFPDRQVPIPVRETLHQVLSRQIELLHSADPKGLYGSLHDLGFFGTDDERLGLVPCG